MRGFFLYLLLALAGTAGAEPLRQGTVPPAPAVSAFSLLQVAFSLLLVLAAIAGLAWLLKRLTPHQRSLGGALKVVSATAVGQRERVVVLEIDDTWLVVGVAPGHVGALHTMPKRNAPAPEQAAAPGEPGFAGWLKQTLERRHRG